MEPISSISFNLFQIIILLGALNGFILSALILIKKSSTNVNIYLILFVLIFAFGSIKIVLQEEIPYFNYYLPIPLLYQFAFGPLLYLYLKSSLFSDYKFRFSLLWHFLPCLLFDVLPAFLLFFLGPEYHYQSIQKLKFISDIVALLFFCYYVYVSLRLIKRYKLYQDVSKSTALRWMNRILLAAILICITWFFYIIAVIVSKGQPIYGMMPYYPIYILLSLCMYSIGMAGYHRPELGLIILPISERKILLSTTEVNEKKESLISLFKQFNYHRDEHITLKILSDKSGIPVKELSYTINVGFGKNFNDFINELRVNDFKTLLKNPTNNKYNILGLAYQVGFNSKASFYRAFKKINHETPGKFYSNLQNPDAK